MPGNNEQETISCTVSDGFNDWIAQFGGSLAVTTYQARQVALIGFGGGRVIPTFTPFPIPTGIAVAGDQLALATAREVTIFANSPALAAHYPGAAVGTYDALFLPRATFYTGDQRLHDVGFGQDGVWMVLTLLSCLATLSTSASFDVKWKPPFISALATEDRCHLNGMAMVNGLPGYVTAVGATDAPEGWRSSKVSGGVIIDVASNQTILSGLSMPHSPRWFDGKLWFLNSGSGELCVMNPQEGRHTVVAVLPGYVRGLCLVGSFAVVGLSHVRQSNLRGGMAVQQRFKRLLCGVAIVDLRNGNPVGILEFTSGVEDLFEIQLLPNVRRPLILPIGSPNADNAVTSQAVTYWIRETAKTAPK